MPAKKDIELDQVIATLHETNGNISLTARKLKVDRKAIQYYINTYATAKAAHDEAAAHVTDIAEGHLVNAVMKGQWDQVRYWLENKARDRGYGQSYTNATLNVTPEQIAGMTDEQLEQLSTQLAKLAGRR